MSIILEVDLKLLSNIYIPCFSAFQSYWSYTSQSWVSRATCAMNNLALGLSRQLC